MRRLILIWILIAGSFSLLAQNRVDHLTRVLDADTVSDVLYVSKSIELCKQVYQTNKEFLIPHYVPEGIKIAKARQDIASESELYWYLGTYYWKGGNFTQAAKTFTELRVAAASRHYKKGSLDALNGLGNVYYMLGDYEKALPYYQEGLQACNGDSVMLLKFYHNIANVFVEENKLDSVIVYYNKSVEYHIRHQNWSDLSLVYQNISKVYSDEENQDKTRQYLDLALEAAEKSGDPRQIAAVYQDMGLIVMERHPNMAITYLKRSAELSRAANSHQMTRDILVDLARIHQTQGNYRKAFESLDQAFVLSDSLSVINNSLSLSEQEQNYQFEMELISQEKALRQKELDRMHESNQQRMIILFLGLAVLALIPLSVLLYQNYRTKARLNETRDKFFSLIAHDLKNPISGLAGLISVMNEEVHSVGNIQEQKRIEALSGSVSRIQELLDNLLDWSRAENGQVAFQPENLNLMNLITDIADLYADSLSNKDQNLEINIPAEIQIFADANMLRSIIRNLISNAIKFSPERSVISINAIHADSETQVTVSDSGIGIDQGLAEQLFKKETHFTSKGTNKETGTGLGLKICGEFVRRHRGHIWVDSKKGEGSSFSFVLPAR